MNMKVVLTVLALLILVAIAGYVVTLPEKTPTGMEELTEEQADQKQMQMQEMQEQMMKMFQEGSERVPAESQ